MSGCSKSQGSRSDSGLNMTDFEFLYLCRKEKPLVGFLDDGSLYVLLYTIAVWKRVWFSNVCAIVLCVYSMFLARRWWNCKQRKKQRTHNYNNNNRQTNTNTHTHARTRTHARTDTRTYPRMHTTDCSKILYIDEYKRTLLFIINAYKQNLPFGSLKFHKKDN